MVTLLVACLGFQWYLGNATGHPMFGVDSPGLSHRIASFLERGSEVNSFGFAPWQVRKLFFPLELTLMTRTRTSKLINRMTVSLGHLSGKWNQ